MTFEKFSPRAKGDICAVGALVALAALLFRQHLLGGALFLGNFDRLNSFLNTLQVNVRGWQSHTFGAWDESMFMGRNLFALPFTYPNVFNYIVALFPADRLFWAAGYVSFTFLCASAVASYYFLRDLCHDQYGAFVGATLYEFCALSTLKVSQNDMSFAVLIHIPLVLLLLRRARPENLSITFATLALILSHLLIFCFLQKVAYALLLFASYSIFLSTQRRSILPLALATSATVVAFIASFPRIYGVVREMHELRRVIAPDFDMKDFDALYKWQNFKSYDFLRWFQDGLFGRFYSEKVSLQNDLNITEGMLLYAGPLVPFLILGSIFHWRGRWMGLFRKGEREALFFAIIIVVAFAVVMSKRVYHIFFELFLRLDFTHTRIVIAALLPLCGLVALFISYWRQEFQMECNARYRKMLIFVFGVAGALVVSLGIESIGDHLGGSSAFELTDSCVDFSRQLRLLLAASLSGTAFVVPQPVGHYLAWMKASVVLQVLGYAVLAVVGAVGATVFALMRPKRSWVAAFLVFLCGDLLVIDAFRYADFQVNGAQVQTARPFADSNSYLAQPNEFIPPNRADIARLRERMESDDFRTVLLSRDDLQLPLHLAPHIGAFWNLRLVEGYSSGVPLRLGLLPWSTQVLGLRTMTFARMEEKQLPWRLLGFLNVKYGIYVNLPFYKDSPQGPIPHGILGVNWTRIVENPIRPVPREFFPRNTTSVTTMQRALSKIFPDHSLVPTMDPVATSVLESPVQLSLENRDGGEVHAKYEGDEILLTVDSSEKTRALVLNELYHPDWHAYVGAKALRVYPANVVMRAVLVPPDISKITLRFEPFCTFRRLGLFCTFAATFALLLAALCRRFGPDSWFPSRLV